MKWKNGLCMAVAVAAMMAGTLPAEAAEYSDIYTFTLEGETYTLPFAVSELTDAGWTLMDLGETLDSNAEIAGLSYSDITIDKDGKECEVSVVNFSEDVAALSTTTVVSITATAEGGAEFQTGAGIDFTKTGDEVLAAYGEALGQGDDYIRYKFAEQKKRAETNGFYVSEIEEFNKKSIGYDEMYFYFSDSGDGIAKIEMEYVMQPEEESGTASSGTEETSTEETGTEESGTEEAETEETGTAETAEESDAEEAENSADSLTLGTDVFAAVVELNDTVYQLPTTVGDLTAGGFEFDLSGDVPGGRENDSVSVYYNNLEAGSIYITNPNKTASPAEDCVVYRLSSDNGTLVLPGGITVGSTLEDLIAAYPDVEGMEGGDNFSKGDYRVSVSDYDESRAYSFANEAVDYTVDISVDTERNVVSEIRAYIYNH